MKINHLHLFLIEAIKMEAKSQQFWILLNLDLSPRLVLVHPAPCGTHFALWSSRFGSGFQILDEIGVRTTGGPTYRPCAFDQCCWGGPVLPKDQS